MLAHVRSRLIVIALAAVVLVATTVAVLADRGEAVADPGAGDVRAGWQTYRDMDGLATLRSGEESKQFSSFDRAGTNDDGFFDSYSCLRRGEEGCVLADKTGAGEIASIWMVGDNPAGDEEPPGSPAAAAKSAAAKADDGYGDNKIKIELDGQVVLDAPIGDVVDGKLGAPFVWPLVGGSLDTKGGMVIKVPMPYHSSMRVTMAESPLFYHVDYREFPGDAGVDTFDPADPAQDVVDALRHFGARDPKPVPADSAVTATEAEVEPGKSVEAAKVSGPGRITQLRVALPQVLAAPQGDDDGRALDAGGESSFRAAVDPGNEGVRLTRRLDGGVAGQRAEVLVDGVAAARWQGPEKAREGEWGSESVEIPRELTAGKSSVTITTRATEPDTRFTEYRYDVHSRTAGTWSRSDTLDLGHWHPGEELAHDYENSGEDWFGISTYKSTVDEDEAARSRAVLAGAKIRASFDGKTTVDAPIGEFFGGSGLGEYDSRNLMSAIDTAADGWYTAWWPMPFAEEAKVELVNESGVPITGATVEVTTAPDASVAGKLADSTLGYFHATHGERETVPPGEDVPLLSASGKGTFYGVSQTMRGVDAETTNPLQFLEGDERAYVDGSASPAWHGTGTEDFYEGGWYFIGGTMPAATPFTGVPAYEEETGSCAQQCVQAGRLLIGDSIPFRNSLAFGMEHGPVNTDPAAQSWTSYWYGHDDVGLRETDLLDTADDADRDGHGYTAGGESRASLNSTLEGLAHTAALERPTTSATGTVSFTATVDADNSGVLLRRLGDQEKAGQSARVLVDGKPAGTWRQPLGNKASRWLEDSFSLPRELVAGKDSVTVELRPESGTAPWSAAQYRVLSEVAGFVDDTAPDEVTGFAAAPDSTNAVNLQWAPAADEDGSVARYEVYAARGSAEVPLTADNLVGVSTGPSFQHRGLSVAERWSYRVRAVDGAGNPGEASPVVEGVSGRGYEVEAEDLLPATSANVELYVPLSPIMSGTAYVLVAADAVDDGFTSKVSVPRDGEYDLTMFWSASPERGLGAVAIDGTPVGDPFDTYDSDEESVVSNTHGSVFLTAGEHELSITSAGKNPESAAFVVGPDKVVLTLR